MKDDGDGFITYTQIIKVIDTIPPSVTCKDTLFCYTGGYAGAGAEPDPMCTVPTYKVLISQLQTIVLQLI
ncbi:MAG: hypothetical protein IPI18_05300 [Saprospiraceae bacterium]|nr:hypothetical protein [Saprospiraceae bacterium]